VVDSTLSTPVATRPLTLGADWVLHSLTKYLNGHGDALGGVVIGRREPLVELRRHALIHFGGALSPFNAWLIRRGLHTLTLRMRAHADSALKVASFLESHPGIKRVIYPGLPSHPQHELARRQMGNFSGMLTFQTKGDGLVVARRVAKRARLFNYAVSLGKQRSLIYYIPTADILRSSFSLEGLAAESYRNYAGDGVFRTSIGLDDPDDLCNDLEQALQE
jgi:cystathionine gamma-synthase/methionine-gamma-lyase